MAGVRAEPVLTECQVKAQFLFNFTRYVEWPEEAFETETSPFVITIAGEDPFEGDLHRVARDRTVNGRSILVNNVAGDAVITGSHILFVPASDRALQSHVLEQASGEAMLTVGEDQHFLRQGGIVNFVSRDGTVRLEIDLRAARAADLYLSAHLLRVADIVRDE